MEKNFKSALTFKKWLLIGFLLLILLVLQNSNVLNFPNNIKPFLIFPFALAFSMFASTKSTIGLSIMCGFLLDCFSERIFGFSALFLLITCTLSSVMCKKFIKIRLFNFIILITLALILFESIDFFIKFISLNLQNIWILWLNHIFPTIAITILISPLFYLINYKIYKIYKNKNKALTSN